MSKFKTGDVIYPKWCSSLFSNKGSPFPYMFLVTENSNLGYECFVLLDECDTEIGENISLELAWTDRDYKLYEF